jgi:hypothetical protein
MEELLKLLQLKKATETSQATQPMGLLGNTEALIGAGLLSQGAAGKGLFEAALPSLTQAAQIRKLVQPTEQKTKAAYDPKTGKTVYATEAEIKAKGLVPPPKEPLVKMDAGETAEQKKIGEVFGTKYEDIAKAGAAAQENIPTLDTISVLNKTKDLKTGFLGEFRTSAEKLANSLGLQIDVQNVPAAEVLSATTGKLVLQGLSNFKGSISDGERKFVKDVNAGLSMSREGIDALVNLQRKGSQITIKYNQEADDWVERNGGLSKKDKITGKSWSQFTSQFHKENPLIDDEQRKNLMSLSKNRSPEFMSGKNIQEIPGKGKFIKIGNNIYRLD